MAVNVYKYWYFNNILSKEKCDYIIKQGEENFKLADVNTKYTKKDLKKVRSSQVCFMKQQYLFDLVNTYLPIANKRAGWNYQHSVVENLQLGRYRPGDHYRWHTDSENLPYDLPYAPLLNGNTRKISMGITLSPPEDYKGGNFQFWFGGPYPVKEFKKQGTLVFFPSSHWHRITPLLKGTRYSLVAWICGKVFQ